VAFDAPGEGGEQRALMADLELSTPLVALGPPDPDAPPPPPIQTLRGYVVYSVCLPDGTCGFRRQEVTAMVRYPGRPGGGPEGPGEEGGGPPGGEDR
jgi:hypothetical protein